MKYLYFVAYCTDIGLGSVVVESSYKINSIESYKLFIEDLRKYLDNDVSILNFKLLTEEKK